LLLPFVREGWEGFFYLNFFVKFLLFLKISPYPSLKKRGVKKFGEGEGGVIQKSPSYHGIISVCVSIK